MLNRFRLIIPAFALFITACSGATAQESAPVTPPSTDLPAITQPPPPAAVTPVASAAPDVVARVNDVDITLVEYERALGRYPAEGLSAAEAASLRSLVLDTMIEQVLIEQAAAEQQIVVSDEAIEAEVQSYIETVGGQEAWTTWLANNGYTEAEFRESLRESFITNGVRDYVTRDLNGNVLQVHARHILVSTQAQADELLARVRSGEDFATLATTYSIDDTTKARGGDLGWFLPEELIEPALSQVLFTLEPGTVAGPIQTGLGFHIVQTLERGERAIPEEKRAELAQTRFENWLSNLRAAANITRFI